jgi:dipeptidyl-peptidase III
LSRPPRFHPPTSDDDIYDPPPPHPEASSSGPSSSPKPPPFSSLYFPPESELQRIKAVVTESINDCLLATAPAPSFEEALAEDEAERKAAAEKAKESSTSKGESSGKGLDDGEPPPPYTEGSSPLDSFTYVMATAGGAASIITQVQQTPGPPINTLGGTLHEIHHDVGKVLILA